MKLSKVLGPTGWVNLHEGDDAWGKAHPTNARHPLSHAFFSGSADLWLKQTGTPKKLMGTLDKTEALIKQHHPDWDENKAHEMGSALQHHSYEDHNGAWTEPGEPGYDENWNRVGKKLGIHPDLVNSKLHDKVFNLAGGDD